MIEVFKTNVTDPGQASMLVQVVHYVDDRYRANFDLEDCDHILRVESTGGKVDHATIIALLSYFGSEAEVLPDQIEKLELA
jgi:hypothetical protein